MPPFAAAVPEEVILDAGVVSANGTLLWATRGGVRVAFAEEVQNMDFDGKRAPWAGGDRVIGSVARISMRIMQVSTAIMAKLMNHGGTQNIASLTVAAAAALSLANAAAMGAFGDGVCAPMSRLMKQGEYLTNVRGTFKRGDGGTAYASLPVARVAWTGIAGGTKDAAEMDVIIESEQDLSSSTDTDVVPWKLILVDP